MNYDLYNFGLVWDNDVDGLIPELWARESLYQLQALMMAPNLVHRDYEPIIAEHGDIVNAHRPANFTAKRKGVNDNVTTQNATVDRVQVPVDQLLHVSFLLRDAQSAWSFPNLVNYFLVPALRAEAEYIDRVVLGQYKNFLGHQVGTQGGMTSSNAHDLLVDLGVEATNAKMPMAPRNLVWSPTSAGQAKKNSDLLTADKRDDGGNAFTRASLGTLLGWNHYEGNHAPAVTVTARASGAINNSGGHAAGTTALTIDGFGAVGAQPANSWCKIGGRFYRIQSDTAGTPVAVSLVSPGLQEAVADDATVDFYESGAVNFGSGYAAGYSGEIAIDGFTDATMFPQVGQLITFGTDPTSTIYTVVTSTHAGSGAGTIELDVPLVAALADDAACHSGPAGNVNFGLVPDAVGLVVRDLPLPNSNLAQSAIVRDSQLGLSMRVVITYDGEAQGHRVTVDMLYGVKSYNDDLAALLIG